MQRDPACSSSQHFLCEICRKEREDAWITTLHCGDSYCLKCLRRLLEQTLQKQSSHLLKCPNIACKQPFTQEDLTTIAYNQEELTQLEILTTHEWLRREAGAKHCPSKDCLYVFINDLNTQDSFTCPSCHQTYCAACLHDHPMTLTCKQAHSLHPEDAESKQWIDAHSKPCPRCFAPIEQNEGCLYMTCIHCNHSFCYNCFGDHHVVVCHEVPATPATQKEIYAQAVGRLHPQVPHSHEQRSPQKNKGKAPSNTPSPVSKRKQQNNRKSPQKNSNAQRKGKQQARPRKKK